MIWLLAAILWLGAPGEAQAGAPGIGPADPPAAARLAPRQLNSLKAGLATAGAALLAWGAIQRRRGRPESGRRLRDGLLAALGAGAALAWTNFGQFHGASYEHPSELYHYVLGAKYFPELGYTRLYACTVLADARAGAGSDLARRRVRDLTTNRLVSGAELAADPARCTDSFTPERWEAFQRDAALIRERLPEHRWERMQGDHGYNATPAWTVLGRALAETGPATPARLLALACIDPLLLAAMWGCVAWAFGWRAMCVGLLFWGTSYVAQFGWTGGSLLRFDWLAAAVVGICLLRRGHPLAAGALLATSALLRIFPVALLAALGLQALLQMARARSARLPQAHARVAAGALLALAVWLPLSAASAGWRAWPEFVANSRLHLDTPLLNHAGLRTVLSYDHDRREELARDPSLEDPVASWKEGRREAFARRAPVFALLVAGYAALLGVAVLRREPWVAAVLGIGLVPVALEVTGYYYALLLGFALLNARSEAVGAALVGLSALGWALVDLFHWTDEIFTWTSLATVTFVVWTTALLAGHDDDPSAA